MLLRGCPIHDLATSVNIFTVTLRKKSSMTEKWKQTATEKKINHKKQKTNKQKKETVFQFWRMLFFFVQQYL